MNLLHAYLYISSGILFYMASIWSHKDALNNIIKITLIVGAIAGITLAIKTP